jgi:predicted oxidoreductase (fatty acid repression mutant protein)
VFGGMNTNFVLSEIAQIKMKMMMIMRSNHQKLNDILDSQINKHIEARVYGHGKRQKPSFSLGKHTTVF